MKMVLLAGVLSFSFLANSETFARPAPKVIEVDKAVLHLCPIKNPRPGCADRIEFDGSDFLLVTTTESAAKKLEAIRKNYTFYHKIETTRPGTAKGVIAREGGHFPNPTVKFDVFKASELNIPFIR